MRFSKRIIALLLLVIMLVPLLCSCAYKAIEPSEEDITVVGQVSGKDVYLDELRFVTNTYRTLMTSRYGEGIFEGEDKQKYLSMLTELVYANITANYATVLLCEDARIKLGEEKVLERVEEKMNETVESLGGVSKYKKYLKENHLTDRLLRFTTEVELLRSELLYVYINDILVIEDNDEKIYDIIRDEFIVTRHIFVSHSTENAKQKIESAAARLNAGEDMGTLIEELGEDSEMTKNGIFILEGYMTDDYEDVAFKLGSLEVSPIVEDEHGYYIIQRMKMQTSAIMLQFDYLKDLYQTYTFYSIIDEKQSELVFVPNASAESYMSDPFN